MIKSMTGFGRFEAVTAEYRVSVEIKAVNHRYLDLGIRMPRNFNCFENDIRNLLKTYIQRGKADVYINYEDYTADTVTLKYNCALAAAYVAAFRKMEEQFGLHNDITVSVLSGMPDVLVMEREQADEKQLWSRLRPVLEETASRFVASRVQEGEKLYTDLLAKLDKIDALVAFVEKRYPDILTEYRSRLEDKVRELLGPGCLDESRLASEVVLYADKACVDEEMVRLHSHIGAMRRELAGGDGIGRKLDFLAQEMNREANTTLSKSSDPAIADAAIALKTEIEKIREQIQNIE